MVAGFIIVTIIGLISVICSAYLFFKWEWRGIIIIAPIIVFLLFWRWGNDFPDFIIPILLGSIAGITFKKGKSFQFFILAASLSMTFLLSADLYYQIHSNKKEIFKFSQNQLERLLAVNEAPEDLKNEIIKNSDYLFETAQKIIPFSYFLFSLFTSSICFFIIKNFFTKIENISSVQEIEYFRLNDYIIFSLIAGWGVYLLIDKKEYEIINIIALNIALITSMLYLIQAIGVLKFQILKRGLPRYLLPLLFIIIFLFGLPALVFSTIMLIGFGTLDLWADFRKIDISDKENMSQ